ncbi:hypothetical protein [Deinococcus sp. NW-56]|uniref:hypothetical protein n=1 Tax=Deinococcus sp. NW-56 TaxID=2080419 RepID=UPI00131A01AC|nr:hypothetical protein [Deinococcus sp. NW-56]
MPDRAWAFPRVAFLAQAEQHRQVQLFAEAELRRRSTVTDPEQGRADHVYGRSTAPASNP